MHNNDNDNMARAHAVFLDYLAERNRQSVKYHAGEPAAYQAYNNEVLTYPVFSNHACQDHDARELLGSTVSDDYCRRWLYFHTPDTRKLPHETYVQELKQQEAGLQQQMVALNAPRLALFSVALVFIVILAARGHFLWTLLPIAITLVYALHSEPALRQKRQQLLHTMRHGRQTSLQYRELKEQLDCLPPAATVRQLGLLYQQAIAYLLRQTLSSLLPPAALADLPASLQRRHWQAFALESWGLLQAPLLGKTGAGQWLLDGHNRMAWAFQPPLGKQPALYRLTYLQVWVLTERGVAIGSGYYDRVADQFGYARHEFLPYGHIRGFHLREGLLPEVPTIRQNLPDTLYQQQFRHPVQILVLETEHGKTYRCAAPLARDMRHSQVYTLETVGLNTDLQQFKRLLHEKIYLPQAV